MTRNKMFIKYSTRKGHFNWSDPSEESYSCHIAVYDGVANKVKSCNIHPDYDLEGTDVYEAIEAIKESLERYWSTSDDRKDMIKFLKKNAEEIVEGTRRRRIAEINSELESLKEEKAKLQEKL